MLRKIRITPLAAESLGVRSMCTLVETPDARLLLDAGVSLCPYRFGLPPHPVEFKTIDKLRRRIMKTAETMDVVIVSHYHYDHHTPAFEDWIVNWTKENETQRQIYQDKQVLIKNPREKINLSQRRRAWIFKKTVGKHVKSFETADGKTFHFGEKTYLRFSEAVFHGSDNSLLGWVVMLLIEYETERFLFAPDVQGPISARTVELIKSAQPQVLLIGGPPFYLSGIKVSEAQLNVALKNLVNLVEHIPITIIEHHALRSENWKERIEQVYSSAQNAQHRLVTAAEFAEEKEEFLEYKRKQLYLENPPSKEFEDWMKQDFKHTTSKPPI